MVEHLRLGGRWPWPAPASPGGQWRYVFSSLLPAIRWPTQPPFRRQVVLSAGPSLAQACEWVSSPWGLASRTTLFFLIIFPSLHLLLVLSFPKTLSEGLPRPRPAEHPSGRRWQLDAAQAVCSRSHS